MNQDALEENDLYIEYIKYIREILSVYEERNEEKYLTVKNDLNTLEQKIHDRNLYLGVVGAFSSGKSTFINSVIHKNLLPTDAVQGTTVTASILKKSDCNDLEITYNNGKVVKYSENYKELLNSYGFADKYVTLLEERKISIWERILQYIRNLFGIQGKRAEELERTKEEAALELFKKIISTETLATDVKCVTLHYRNDNIPFEIALVDTPGIESVNQRHNEVTKNAIDNICDAIVVIIPHDKPVSEDLVKYIDENLAEHIGECIFVVTKVELLGDREELPRLLKVIKKRLENRLLINEACVIPMPTFLYLKNVDTEMNVKFLNEISNEDTIEFLSMYESGLQKINEVLKENRKRYIKKKVLNICERISAELNKNLMERVKEYDEKNQALEANSVNSLDNFKYYIFQEIENGSAFVRKRNQIRVDGVELAFADWSISVREKLNKCTDITQLIASIEDANNQTFDRVTEWFEEYLGRLEKAYNSQLEKIEKIYYTEYEVCGIKKRNCRISLKSIDAFTESFLEESMEILQQREENIAYTIRKETSGLLKKITFLFGNQLEKYKNFAITQMNEVIDDLKQQSMDYMLRRITSIYNKAEQKMKDIIERGILEDSEKVENYINATHQKMHENSENRIMANEYINTLNKYIKNMKEDE